MKVRIPKMSIKARVGVTALACSALLGALAFSISRSTTSPKMILTAGNDFTITGQLSSTPAPNITPGAFYPGAQRYFVLTVHNPLGAAITVTSLGVTVSPDSSSTPLPQNCDASNLRLPATTVEQLQVPSEGTAAAWLPVSMVDSGANQDGCQGAKFYFTYSGAAEYIEVYPTATAITSPTTHTALVGQSVTYVASVTPGLGNYGDQAPSAPTGTVTFDDGSNIICPNVSVTQTGNASRASCTTTYLTAGPHTITAMYADNTGGDSGTGDGNFSPSSSNAWPEVINPAPTSVTLVSGQNPSLFGQSVTLTANVSPSLAPQPSNPTPVSGTVSFYRSDPSGVQTPIGTGTLASGAASIKTTALPGGTYTLYAVYSGDSNYTTSTSGTITQQVNFTSGSTCLTGTYNGGFTVKFGQSICLTNSQVNGGITVQPGGALTVTNSTVNGGLSSNGASALRVCSTVVNGALGVINSSGFVMVGDGNDDGVPVCGPNTLNGNSTLTGNTGGFEFAGNKVNGGATFTGNVTTAASGEASTEVEGNIVSGSLSCAATNNPPLTSDQQKNSVSGTTSGQCTRAGF